MASKFMIPPSVYLGENALEEAVPEICSMGRRACIVTGKSMLAQGHVQHLIRLLKEGDMDAFVFSGITGEPDDRMIYEGLTFYREEKCDCLIGFGGGSPMDAAKAIGAMAVNPGMISDYNGKVMNIKTPPVIAIPTTAGTGSEATKFTVISDTDKGIKMLLKGDVLLPAIAVVDPSFTVETPPQVTAATGLDALTHAVESYISIKAMPLTDAYAISAIKRILKWLPEAFQDGGNKRAREEMAAAALEAGICINNSSVTLVHGMSRPIGALFHVPHGISNAMLLNKCLGFVKKGYPKKFARLSYETGIAPLNMEEEAAADAFLIKLEEICKICKVPDLKTYGIDEPDFFRVIDKMAKDAWDSGSPSNVPGNITVSDIKEIYESLWI